MSAPLAPLRRVPIPWILLPVLATLWIVPRFVGTPAPPGAAVEAAVESVTAGPSPRTGRLEVRGLPSPDADPGGLLSRPEILAARARLHAAIRTRNDALSLRAADIARRLEPTEDDLVGLRLSGWLIPFYGPHAGTLRRLEAHAVDRPWEALRALTVTLEARLEEPPEGVDLEISGQRRDLTRLYREVDDALVDAEAAVRAAVDTFGADVRMAAVDAAGPFRRRGRGLLLEILLTSLLGATLREAIRARRTTPGMIVRISMAPVLAAGTLLALQGTALLPVDPLRGVSLAFLPAAFVLGYATGAFLTVASRLDRLVRDDPPAAPAAPARETGEPAPPRASDAGPTDPSSASREAPSLRPLRELVQEVMTVAGETPRSERELPEEPSRPAGAAPARPASRRDPDRLPFARRRPR